MAVDKLVDSSQLDSDLTAVANAIRAKGGTSGSLAFPSGFTSAIEAIPTGSSITVEPKSITENGTYTAPSGVAYSPITVNVSGGGSTFTQYVTFTAEQANSSVALTSVGTWTTDWNIWFSVDNTNWTPYTMGATQILTNVGDYVSFAGKGNWGVAQTTSNYHQFVMTGRIAGSGNCNGLISQDSALGMMVYGFYKLFWGNQSLTTAPSLPSTTLANNCYSNMFNGCTSLITAPSLPATTLTLSCYQSMFSSCSSLVTAPSLPATILANNCYSSMFFYCTSLTTAPSLPATTLKINCYSNMFYGCTSLTIAPSLPATNLANYCYSSMFQYCSALITAPSLPATILANNCYQNMFSYCSSLITAPVLSATTLITGCYAGMFSYCSSLTTVPQLLATAMVNSCYSSMFYQCSSLYVSDTSGSGYSNVWSIPTSGTATGDYTMSNMFSGCLGTRSTQSPNFNGVQKTYYTQNAPV